VDTIGKAYASYYTHRSGSVAYEQDNGRSVLWVLANGYMNKRFGSNRMPSVALGEWLVPLAFPLRQQLDFFYRHLPRTPARLLDVGCGNGVFLLRAKAAGWSVTGLEPDPVAAAGVRECGVDVHCGTLETFHPREAFDVATASHVIEHVHDPKAFLQQIIQLLRDGGSVWLATPNVESIGHRVFGRAWRGLEPPRHITIFSARALRTLLESAGFCDIRFRRRGRGASYILEASRKLAAARAVKPRRLPTMLVDLLASCSATVGEELVVTARKPT
jgi:2-polyprenyl-3-methyl-5-hydroxy-6-metoxy-1,4-benzoquinol methylase